MEDTIKEQRSKILKLNNYRQTIYNCLDYYYKKERLLPTEFVECTRGRITFYRKRIFNYDFATSFNYAIKKNSWTMVQSC